MSVPAAIPSVEFRSLGSRPIRQAVRRLRWFKSSFDSQVDSVSTDTGISFTIDHQRLTRCFLQWLQSFEAQKPAERDNRHAYVGFAAGLMLKQLVTSQPLTVKELPEGADLEKPAYFWPEGYVYVVYCLNVRHAVLKQEFNEDVSPAPEFSEVRTWWSFRENVSDDPSLTIPFLDLFAGDDPNWTMPQIFRNRDTDALASRFQSTGPALPDQGSDS